MENYNNEKPRRVTRNLIRYLEPIPNQSSLLFFELNKLILKKDFTKISYGLLAHTMEDRWIIYEEEKTLYLYRSWSHQFIAMCKFKEISNIYFKIYSIAVNKEVDFLRNNNSTTKEIIQVIEDCFSVKFLEK